MPTWSPKTSVWGSRSHGGSELELDAAFQFFRNLLRGPALLQEEIFQPRSVAAFAAGLSVSRKISATPLMTGITVHIHERIERHCQVSSVEKAPRHAKRKAHFALTLQRTLYALNPISLISGRRTRRGNPVTQNLETARQVKNSLCQRRADSFAAQGDASQISPHRHRQRTAVRCGPRRRKRPRVLRLLSRGFLKSREGDSIVIQCSWNVLPHSDVGHAACVFFRDLGIARSWGRAKCRWECEMRA